MRGCSPLNENLSEIKQTLWLDPVYNAGQAAEKTIMRQIKESDWKILRQLHKVALERYCQGVLSEIARLNNDDAKSFHQRYLDIFRVVQDRDKEIARIFDDLRRSTALYELAAVNYLAAERRGLFGSSGSQP